MAKGLSKMMKEAQKLEKRLAAVQEALRQMTVEASAGGGAVRVTMNGQRDVLELVIDQEVMEGSDAAMLEDLLISALREAKRKSDELAAREMSKVTGAALPGLSA
jgi:DNA-binding YbaB/EbfC family protein